MFLKNFVLFELQQLGVQLPDDNGGVLASSRKIPKLIIIKVLYIFACIEHKWKYTNICP